MNLDDIHTIFNQSKIPYNKANNDMLIKRLKIYQQTNITLSSYFGFDVKNTVINKRKYRVEELYEDEFLDPEKLDNLEDKFFGHYNMNKHIELYQPKSLDSPIEFIAEGKLIDDPNDDFYSSNFDINTQYLLVGGKSKGCLINLSILKSRLYCHLETSYDPYCITDHESTNISFNIFKYSKYDSIKAASLNTENDSLMYSCFYYLDYQRANSSLIKKDFVKDVETIIKINRVEINDFNINHIKYQEKNNNILYIGNSIGSIGKIDLRCPLSEWIITSNIYMNADICMLKSKENLLVSSAHNRRILVHDIRKTYKELFSYKHDAPVRGLDFNDHLLISGGGNADKRIKIFDFNKGKVVFISEPQESQITDILLLNNKRFVCAHGHYKNNIKIFDINYDYDLTLFKEQNKSYLSPFIEQSIIEYNKRKYFETHSQSSVEKIPFIKLIKESEAFNKRTLNLGIIQNSNHLAAYNADGKLKLFDPKNLDK